MTVETSLQKILVKKRLGSFRRVIFILQRLIQREKTYFPHKTFNSRTDKCAQSPKQPAPFSHMHSASLNQLWPMPY